jgi:hypothetical protein
VNTKTLIAIPSPRDLPKFEEATAKLPADKLFVKYMYEQPAYETIREFFLTHTEYTHLAILPDDLLVTPEHYYQLVDDIERYNFDVVCGVCNLDKSEEHNGMLNICIDHMPSISRNQHYRTYKWLMEGSPEHERLLLQNPPIIPVVFAGFPFQFFSRRTIEQFTFKDDRIPYTPDKLIGCCVDSMTSADLYDLGIPIQCDLRVRTIHMKIDDSQVEGRMVGIKQPNVSLIPYQEISA